MLKNGIYNTLGSVIRMGIGIISIPLQIKYLGVEEYGIWSWIMSIYAISMLAEAGMAVSTTVFVSEQLASKNEKTSTGIKSIVVSAMLLITIIGIVILCLLFFFSGKIANFFYQSNPSINNILVSSLKIIGFYVMFSMQQQVFTGVLQAYERYGLLNFLKVLQFVALHCGFLVIAYNGGNTYSLTQWAIFVMFISTLIFIFISFKIVGLKSIYIKSINLEYFNKILSYSGWTWFISMGAAMFSQGDKFILGSIFPATIIGM
jgi:O-antigen/teichoic acid export membrane protein